MQHQQVGVKFVEQYFDVLTHNPEGLVAFYAADSSYSCGYHATDRLKDEAVTGLEGIKAKIVSQNFGNAFVDISTLDIHMSASDSVIVMVVGTLTKDEEVSSRFVHTFHLAQPKPNHFCVASGIFRYLDPETRPEAEEKEADVAAKPEANGTEVPVAKEVKAVEEEEVVEEKPAEEPQATFSYAAVAATAQKAPVEEPKKQQEARKEETRKEEKKPEERKSEERNKKASKSKSGRTLFVRCEGKKLLASKLEQFNAFGDVEEVQEKANFCLITYTSTESVEAALACATDLTDSDGNRLVVELSHGGSKKSGRGSGRGGGGRGGGGGGDRGGEKGGDRGGRESSASAGNAGGGKGGGREGRRRRGGR